MNISDRKRTILTALIAIHTQSGDPVGSGILSRFLDTLSVSSATLRNEMAELTALGLLEQPYTSAGRIPTRLGIRYYIDNLMNPRLMDEAEKESINRIIHEMDNDPEKATEMSASVLSDIFGLSIVAMTPHSKSPHIVHFNILKIGRYNYALIGVTNAGSIQSRVSRVDQDISEAEMHLIEDILNKHLVFISPEDVDNELRDSVGRTLTKDTAVFLPLLNSAMALIENLSAYRLYTDGEQNLLGFREMFSQILPYLKYINDPRKIASLLTRSDDPVSIYIGEEIDSSIPNMGMVTGQFRAGRLNGYLAVAGPSRMNYAYIVPRLGYFCNALSVMFSEQDKTKRSRS